MSWQDSVIGALSTAAADGGAYQVTRGVQGAFSAATGDYVDGAASSITIDATVQPYTGRALQTVVEGRHTTDILELLTTTELFIETSANVADRLTFRAATYEVVQVDGPLSLAGGTHYQCYAARLSTP